MKIKVWEIADDNYYAGKSEKSVRRAYREDIGEKADQLMEKFGPPVLLSEEDMRTKQMTLVDEPGQPTITFAEALSEMIVNNVRFPSQFASSEY